MDADQSVQLAVFVRTGDYWTVSFAGSRSSLKNIKGLHYIEHLLKHPGEEFHVLDLAIESCNDTDSDTDISSVLHDPTLSISRLGDSGEMLDTRAIRDYKRRLDELREEFEDLRERGAHDRAAKVESEIEFLEREIVRAVGLGGRSRRAGSAAERARLNITRLIRTGLQKISEHNHTLGELLDRSIRTGTFCSYFPDPRTPISWQFSLEETQRLPEIRSPAPVVARHDTYLQRTSIGRTMFVGRETEQALLRRHLDQVLRGVGAVVMIEGTAGVGKTRLAAEFSIEASKKGVLTFSGACYDRNDPVPFVPFVEMLETTLATSGLAAIREVLGEDITEIARLLPQLRRLFPDIPPPLELAPEQSRWVLFNAVAEVLTRMSAARPVLLVLEDLHWADEETLALVTHLGQSVSKMPVLIVGTYRDFELQPTQPLAKAIDELIRYHVLNQVSLSGLLKPAVAKMIEALAGQAPTEEVTSLIYSETEGNPFFIEELLQHLVEQDQLLDKNGEIRRDLKLDELNVPRNLRLVIGRRIARLSDGAQKALGTAAIIGRAFTFELLQQSVQADVDSLLDWIEEAEKAGLIASTMQCPEVQFRFSHELIRQAVVSGLSGARRQRLHLDVADALERLYANTLEDSADDLAYHLSEAGTAADAERTVRYLAIAAKRASEQGVLTKAEGRYRQALNALGRMPETSARNERELMLRLALGGVSAVTQGYLAAESAAAYGRVSALGERLGDSTRKVLALTALAALPLLRGEMREAQALADQVLAEHNRDGSQATLMWGHQVQGIVRYHCGDLAQASKCFERAIAAYGEEDHRSNPHDPGVETLDYAALAAWQLGMADSARASMNDAIALTDRLGKPYARAHNRFFGAYLCVLLRDSQTTQQLSEAVIELSNERSIPLFFDAGRILYGWALAEQGRCDDGVRYARDGLMSFMAAGNRIAVGSFLGLLAEAQARAGALSNALATVEEALGAAPDQLVDLPYLLWLRGEFLVQKAGQHASARETSASGGSLGTDLAEQSFREAISLATRIGARSYALRAATSLSRLLKSCGRSTEALKLLAPLYTSFVEGLDTCDLIKAKMLLDEIN
ncbi:MAG: AAA family ATPase [Deltaproteobacteria bacterium]|nr:AAA family ATPase [Deltaproteobacteria bacterium]